MPKTIELSEVNIILKIPEEAFSVKLTASLLGKKDKVEKVEKKLNLEEIRKARQDFLDNVDLGDDYDGKFVITEEGRRFLEEMKGG